MTADPMGACSAINPPQNVPLLRLIHAPKADLQLLPSHHGSLLLGTGGKGGGGGGGSLAGSSRSAAFPEGFTSLQLRSQLSQGFLVLPIGLGSSSLPGALRSHPKVTGRSCRDQVNPCQDAIPQIPPLPFPSSRSCGDTRERGGARRVWEFTA